jgi:glycogen operon protein
MRSVVADPAAYDWEGDRPLARPCAQTLIYELHVRGFTRHPSSEVPAGQRGTYAGLVEKIPYLRDLGVTAVELLPVFQFDAQDAPPGRVNYWGYQPVSFFAPHQAYSSRPEPLGALDEFRDMVKALHRAGIEVILDVVYNHTSEGGAAGPTLCHRGLANDVYYILEGEEGRYADFTGCGNTLNANQPIVRRLIQDSLRHWVTQMHVDGFRFDLASILTRDQAGRPLPDPPVLWDIESDPVLAGTKLIAEAWDAAGLYQVGSFVGDSWQEWNGRFRDDVRRFVKGDEGAVPAIAARLLGSPDIYGHESREAEQSVNFVTCHDGFTLNDLVSYDRKHNEANGEDNRDGTDDNSSWNCGVEGPTDDPAIVALRERQMRNFLATLFLSQGIPMLLGGDELARTQQGNNNAYCQDGELSWFHWPPSETGRRLMAYTRRLIALKQANPVFHRRMFFQGRRIQGSAVKDLAWFGPDGHEMTDEEWQNSLSRGLGLRLAGDAIEEVDDMGEPIVGDTFLILLNAHHEPVSFVLPPHAGRVNWELVLDTRDWDGEAERPPLGTGERYTLQGRSLAVLRLGGSVPGGKEPDR